MKRLFFALAFSLGVLAASAQRGAPQTGISAAMIQMFGDIKAFTAQADVHLMDKEQKEISAIPMTFALRDGKMRVDMDLSQAKGSAIPPEAAAMLKQAGMDKMVSLIQPDRKVTAIMYPAARAYAEVPVSEDEVAGEKVEFTDVAKEMVNGHPCQKVKLTSTDAKGKTQVAFVWRASDLKDFPIQMQMAQKANTVLVKFRDPKLESPAATQFDIPAGYTKYPNPQALLQAVMMKMLSGAVE
ncbi:MAG TPA: DUF4412 domain-containing protein [Methylomirabilota bacterium]|nr:DUF4412 domain-containing protein [Methylomirabilota bacterium]